MTKIQFSTRNDRAHEAIDAIIRKTIKAPAPVRWSVAAVDNHSGEPSLYVYVEMPNERDIPGLAERNRLVTALLGALERIDDERFPYLSFGPREGDEGGDDSALENDDD
jgi:hypothetical protein